MKPLWPRHRSHWILLVGAIAVVTTAILGTIVHAGGITVRELLVLRDTFRLETLVQGTVTKRASGVIKNENADTGVLLLLVDKVCEDSGGNGVAFAKPYCKEKLNEPVDCKGAKKDRYRVEQRTLGDPACPPTK